MTDPIILRGPRKSILREHFRAVQREHGTGTIVAFANGRARHVQECLRGLLETESITEPVYSDEGFAVVKIVQDLDEGTPVDLGENAPSPPDVGAIVQTNVAGDELVVPSNGDGDGTVPTDPSKLIPHPDPPPTSGPGSGADAWRTYAAKVTGIPFESWSKMSRAEIIADLEDKGTPVD